MPELVWDKVGDRAFESGLDKGVLYLPDGSAVPWNGLTSIIESFNKDSSPVYYDGMKINDLITLGEFSATMKAVTYPHEFVELEGLASMRRGVFATDQRPKSFGLCYRTQVGNDLDGEVVGYKIHLLYNVIAVPTPKTYASVTASPSLVEFEWQISAVPEEVPGFLPTAHFVIDTTNIDPWLLEDIEQILYGNSNALAVLLPLSELAAFINNWYRVEIIDNGDGTWTAITTREGFIGFGPDESFIIDHVKAIYLTDDTFQVSSTRDETDVPQISIQDNGDGTWSATVDNDLLISDNGDGTIDIRNATIVVINSISYQISNTEETER